VNVFKKDWWINPFLASGSTGITIDEFNNDNFDHSGLGFVGGAGISANLTNGRPIGNRRLPPGTPRWGTKWKEASAEWYAHSFSMQAQGSSYPHRDNYLDLDPVYRDAYGLPLMRMTFDWRENDMKMSEHCTKKIAEIAKATDATIAGPAAPRKSPFDTRVYQSTHVTGGTPMGADPKNSRVPALAALGRAEPVRRRGVRLSAQCGLQSDSAPRRAGVAARRRPDELRRKAADALRARPLPRSLPTSPCSSRGR
jgi:gluconate 2-dehydrogenase alpha chain